MGKRAVILIVDDDSSIRSLVRLQLETEGYSVFEASGGLEALEMAKSNRDIDLIILDIMMPDISGIEMCERLRAFSVVPVLFLTARTQQEDKLAEVHSLLRRYLVYRGKVTEAQGISLDLEKRVVMKNGEKVEMTDLEMSIISYLFSRKGEVVSIQDIYENVWGERFFSQSSNTVMVHILNIRKKLEEVTNNLGAIPNLFVTDFIKEMDKAYAAADLVISRAGAGSISEFCLLKKPVILVPSPNVAEDHQTKNALALSTKDAAIYVKDAEAQEKLIPVALATVKDNAKLASLQQNIAKLALPNSARIIAQEVLKLVEG